MFLRRLSIAGISSLLVFISPLSNWSADAYHKTNKNDLKARLSSNGWQVIYAKEITQKDMLKFVGEAFAGVTATVASGGTGSAAAATAVTASFTTWLIDYVDGSIDSMKSQVIDLGDKQIQEWSSKKNLQDVLKKVLQEKENFSRNLKDLQVDVGIALYTRAECEKPFGKEICIWTPPTPQPFIRFRTAHNASNKNEIKQETVFNSEELFRISNRLAYKYGFVSGFPNFEQGGSNRNPVHGTVFINPEAAISKDIPIAELDNPRTFEDKFRSIQDWATKHGYGGGYPNFEEGTGVYGSILINSEAGYKKNVPINDLEKIPGSNEDKFYLINRYAISRGYAAGFPDFNQDINEKNETVLGVILIKKEAAIRRDVSLDETILMRLTGDIPKPTTFALRSNNTTPNARQTNTPPKTYQEVDVPGVALKLSTRQTNTTSNTRQATPSNPIATSFPPAKGLTQDQVLERLSGIPVFTIVDDRNNPLLVDNPQQSKKQASFYLGADEAEVMLNQFKTAYPEVGSKAKIITRSMKDIYQFMSQNRGKNVAFKFVSKRSNIEAARSIWAAQGKPIDQVPEVPVFFATVQQANGQRLLTVDHNGGKIIPIFFDKSDLEGLLNRNRETVQKIINIQVTSLFQTLDSMITKNNQPNPEVELFQFVSSGAALDYAKRNRQ